MKLSASQLLLTAGTAAACALLLLVGSPADAGPERSSPAIDDWPSLTSVQMLDATHGWAVGGYTGGAPMVPPLARHWNGRTWTTERAVAPAGTKFPLLSQVDTVANGNVWAIGNNAAPDDTAYADHWLGSTVSLVHFAGVPDMFDLFMLGIASTAPHNVWAVGEVDSPTVNGGVLEHWDGSKWSISAETGYGTVLSAIDFAGNTDGWAAGATNPPSGRAAVLTDRWNGTQWEAGSVSVPGPQGQEVDVQDVVTISPSDAWIIGSSGPQSGGSVPFALHWNGQSWAFHPMDRFSRGLYFASLAAVGPDDVWAVGRLDRFKQSVERPVIEHWDGHLWRPVSSPHHDYGMWLDGVSAVAASNVWAVGYSFPDPTRPLIDHWNGNAWTRWTAPTLPSAAPFGGSRR